MVRTTGGSGPLSNTLLCPSPPTVVLLRGPEPPPGPTHESSSYPSPNSPGQQRSDRLKRPLQTPWPLPRPSANGLPMQYRDFQSTASGTSFCVTPGRAFSLHVDSSEALKLWWLEAHARAVRRGELQLPTTPSLCPPWSLRPF